MVSQPVQAQPALAQTPDPAQPSKFDNLYLDPQPTEDTKDSTTHGKSHEETAVSTAPKETVIERTRTTFSKPELPPVAYAKRTWVLHQHEDLQPRIEQVHQAITSQAEQRAAILANELLFFEKVNKAEKSLRDKMLREDKRQHEAGVCWAYRSTVVQCLMAGRNCEQEIAGWKHCEAERN